MKVGRSPGSEEETFVGTRDEPDDDLEAEPSVTNAFHEEEGLVGIGLSLIERPEDLAKRNH